MVVGQDQTKGTKQNGYFTSLFMTFCITHVHHTGSGQSIAFFANKNTELNVRKF